MVDPVDTMSLRDLVMGGAGCSAPGVGPSTANPMAGLADSLIGGAAKQQVWEQLSWFIQHV